MTSFAKLFLFLCLIILTPRLWAQGGPSAKSILGTSMAVEGEEIFLTLITSGIDIIDWPQSPPTVTPLGLQKDIKELVQISGFVRQAYRYRIIAFKPGTYRIPPFRFETSSGVVTSEAHVLRVFPMDRLTLKGIKPDQAVTPYFTGVFLEKTEPYVGEQQDVEAKLYLSQAAPNRLSLQNGKVIQFAKDGLAAWRFTTLPKETGYLDYENQRFRVYTYRSSMSALREGPLTLGPGVAPTVFSYQTRLVSLPIQFPSVNLNARPLPDGAPEGFERAVGTFSMTVTPLNPELDWGDAVTVEIDITGSGNIDKFPGPRLLDPNEDWKQFDMVAKASGEERRSSSGIARFSQLVRPLTTVKALPPYRFVYFDPLVSEYRTLKSSPVPLLLKGGPGSKLDSSGKFPFLSPGQLPLKNQSIRLSGQWWWWQVFPALVIVILFALEIKRHFTLRQLAGEPARKLAAAIHEVSKVSGDQAKFYREACRIATEWRGGEEFDELRQTRDEICFHPDRKPKAVESDERDRVLTLLRSLTPLLILGLSFLAFTVPVRALPDDYEVARKEILANMKQEPDAAHFYNLALCEKALNNPGQAVLWAYRFKLYGGNADEFLKNLPGAREKEEDWPAGWIAVFPRDVYLQLITAGAWSFGILFTLLLTRRSKARPWMIAGLSIFGSIALLGGSASWFWYSEGISYQPLQTLAVITGKSPIRSEPFDEAGEVRETPIGSLCKIAATRGEWSRVILPGSRSGWIRNREVESIVIDLSTD